MNIAGLDKNQVFAVLYNRAVPRGIGFFQYDRRPWTAADAVEWRIARLDRPHDPFNYNYSWVNGRCMWICIAEDEVNTDAYNKFNGPNAAEFAIEDLKRTGEVNPLDVDIAHGNALEYSISEAKHLLTTVKNHPTTKGVRDESHIYYSEEDAKRLRPVLDALVV